MQSTIHLFNIALARLAGEQIPYNRSPDEHDATGDLCQNLFPHVLDMALSAHEWGFAKRRVTLAELPRAGQQSANPDYGYSYAIPADCVKTVRLDGYNDLTEDVKSPAFIIEGNAILSNVEHAVLLYVGRVEDPRQWPPAFADTLAWGLAGELSSARINDSGKQQWCYQNYEMALSKAIAKDRAGQNPYRPSSAWLDARGTGLLELSDGRRY